VSFAGEFEPAYLLRAIYPAFGVLFPDQVIRTDDSAVSALPRPYSFAISPGYHVINHTTCARDLCRHFAMRVEETISKLAPTSNPSIATVSERRIETRREMRQSDCQDECCIYCVKGMGHHGSFLRSSHLGESVKVKRLARVLHISPENL